MTIDVTIVHTDQVGFLITADARRGLTFRHLRWPTHVVLAELTLPYPRHGYGGAELSISPHAKYAAALLYSGQSETGYELFELFPRLQHIGGLAYVRGESDLTPVQFSLDETLAAVVIEENTFWWIDPKDPEPDWDTTSVGGRVEWAKLIIHPLGEEKPLLFPLVVDLPAGWRASAEDGTWPAELRFESNRELSLGTPWGSRCNFSLPPSPAEILISSPT